MAMRDPKEMAREWMARVAPAEDYDEESVSHITALIREAQEDGGRIERAFAERVIREKAEDRARAKSVIEDLRTHVAALTERAERAERELQEMKDAKRYSADEAMGRVCPACGW